MSEKPKVNTMSNSTSSKDIRDENPLERRRFLAWLGIQG